MAAWGWAGALALAALVVVGLWLRLRGLAAEGFADDEVHKWLAANRYLAGDFGGDDVEHPMLMKLLIAACIALGRPLGWAPETMVRLPNALAGGGIGLDRDAAEHLLARASIDPGRRGETLSLEEFARLADAAHMQAGPAT